MLSTAAGIIRKKISVLIDKVCRKIDRVTMQQDHATQKHDVKGTDMFFFFFYLPTSVTTVIDIMLRPHPQSDKNK